MWDSLSWSALHRVILRAVATRSCIGLWISRALRWYSIVKYHTHYINTLYVRISNGVRMWRGFVPRRGGMGVNRSTEGRRTRDSFYPRVSLSLDRSLQPPPPVSQSVPRPKPFDVLCLFLFVSPLILNTYRCVGPSPEIRYDCRFLANHL